MMPSKYWEEMVEKNWNVFAVQVVTAPLLWYHLTSILDTSQYIHYNFIVRVLLLFYFVMIFVLHEIIRIFVVKLMTKQMTPSELINKILEILKRLIVLMETSEFGSQLILLCRNLQQKLTQIFSSQTKKRD